MGQQGKARAWGQRPHSRLRPPPQPWLSHPKPGRGGQRVDEAVLVGAPPGEEQRWPLVAGVGAFCLSLVLPTLRVLLITNDFLF